MASLEEFGHLKIKLEDITSATNNFDERRLIGSGGYGNVYKGELPQFYDGRMAAFKRLNPKLGQGEAEFNKEIRTLGRYKHENIISLLGFCNENNEKVLVYELASRGSLSRHLPSPTVTWTQRLKICLAASKGLTFIHDPDGKYQRVIHCDIKSDNILLDDNWNAKVSDFGLSEMAPANQQDSAVYKSPSGTYGYIDPKFVETETLTKESDVYSFGVVLFEVLCGTLCLKYKHGQVIDDLVPKWKETQENKKLNDYISEGLTNQQRDPCALKTFLDIAYRCLRNSPKERPTMADVVVELEIALGLQEYKERPTNTVSRGIYRSEEEKHNARLSAGIFVNGGKTWLSVNRNLKHCELISIAECLVDYKSRFSGGFYEPSKLIFTTHVRARFLSPGTPYTVNLVFKNKKPKELYIGLEYKLKDGKKSYSFLADDEKEDGWLTAELYQLTSNGRGVDLEILFDMQHCPTLLVEGIEFQPQEEEQYVETQPMPVPDMYWNENLPSKDKETDDYLMLPTRAALKDGRWKSLPKTRFEVTHNSSRKFDISCDIRLNTLPREITYATYLVYKQEEGHDRVQPGPAHVRDKKSDQKDIRHVYLQTPQTPVIGKNVDKYTYNTSHRPKIKGLPKQLSDDWMEVQIWEFRTTNKSIPVHLELYSYDDSLEGIEVQGIEFRPV